MSGFNFSKEQSFVNTSKPILPGGEIHTVKFVGTEYTTYEAKDNSGTMYNIFKIKFENENGYFTESIFEPKPGDENRGEATYNNETFPTPSRIEEIQLEIGHFVEAVAPGAMEKLAGKPIPDFKTLCSYITQLTKKSEGKETNIKLMLTKDRSARFPIFAKLSRDGEAYISSNFIGDNLFFNDKEKATLSKISSATPTNMPNIKKETVNTDLDLDLDLDL